MWTKTKVNCSTLKQKFRGVRVAQWSSPAPPTTTTRVRTWAVIGWSQSFFRVLRFSSVRKNQLSRQNLCRRAHWSPGDWVTTPNVTPLKKLSVLMLCVPSSRRRPFLYHTKMADFKYFRLLSIFSWKNTHRTQNTEHRTQDTGHRTQDTEHTHTHTHTVRHKLNWIWQVATVRSINHKVGALKELSCWM